MYYENVIKTMRKSGNNVIKYAKATKLSIQINRDEEGITLSIEDNGIGFDPHKLKDFDGIGLKSMHNRVASLRGSLEIDSKPGKGTSIHFYIPA